MHYMASDNVIILPVEITDIRPRADRSWKISVETRELTGREVAIFADAFQGAGWIAYSRNELDDVKFPDAPAEPGTKTPSQRLRASIMVLWQQQGSKGDPESFYRTYMEKLIEYVQSKLGDKPIR